MIKTAVMLLSTHMRSNSAISSVCVCVYIQGLTTGNLGKGAAAHMFVVMIQPNVAAWPSHATLSVFCLQYQ